MFVHQLDIGVHRAPSRAVYHFLMGEILMKQKSSIADGCCRRTYRGGSILVGVLLVLWMGLFVTSSAFAQADSGSISGTVKDASGAIVAGAKIESKNIATGATRTAE